MRTWSENDTPRKAAAEPIDVDALTVNKNSP
jgi:hypothetical protein